MPHAPIVIAGRPAESPKAFFKDTLRVSSPSIEEEYVRKAQSRRGGDRTETLRWIPYLHRTT